MVGVSHDEELDHTSCRLKEFDPFIMGHILQGVPVDVSDLIVNS